MTSTTTQPATLTVTFAVSGAAMSCISGSELAQRPEKYDGGTPGAVAAHAALYSAPSRKAGKGTSYTVTVSLDGAAVIEDYCRTVGQTFVGETEAETKADGRALLVVADRIHAALAAMPAPVEEAPGATGARTWDASTTTTHVCAGACGQELPATSYPTTGKPGQRGVVCRKDRDAARAAR